MSLNAYSVIGFTKADTHFSEILIAPTSGKAMENIHTRYGQNLREVRLHTLTSGQTTLTTVDGLEIQSIPQRAC